MFIFVLDFAFCILYPFLLKMVPKITHAADPAKPGICPVYCEVPEGLCWSLK
jgi:hypothetical protein